MYRVTVSSPLLHVGVSAAVQAHESLTLENAAASLARSLLANPSPLSRALAGVTAP